jgi:hypothetical protein
MTEHILKCHPEHFAAIDGGWETVELRLNDRPYARGDALMLREFDPIKAQAEYEALCAAWHEQPQDPTELFAEAIARLREEAHSRAYTGRQLRVRVTHVLSGGPWLSPGYVAMSIRLMGEDGRARVQEDFRKSYDDEREAHDKTRERARAWKRAAQQERGIAWTLGRDGYIAERARADAAIATQRALCDVLSADGETIAGQTLVEAVRSIIAARDAALARAAAAERRLGEALAGEGGR